MAIAATLYLVIPMFDGDAWLLHGSNVLIFLTTFFSGVLVLRSLKARPQAFVRGVYGGTLSKMMVLMIALVTYIMLNRATVHKPSLFVVFGIYLLYAALEAVLLSNIARKK